MMKRSIVTTDVAVWWITGDDPQRCSSDEPRTRLDA
jgi:hypothetical protein